MIIITSPTEKFSGELFVPGDKSITHRALMLGVLARGITDVRGFLDAEDCRSTINCLRSLGAKITIRGRRVLIEGRNMSLKEPEGPLDAGNSGTTARLMLGILAGQPFTATLTGDRSLQKRPMKRVTEPLRSMGATVEGEGEHLPLTITGGKLNPIEFKSPQASAQVKSALLLAGLYAEGTTTVEEPYTSRNHTELMLAQFGAKIEAAAGRISLKGRQSLRGGPIRVPGDISAASFFMVAAAMRPGSEVLLKNIGVNPTRSGIIDALLEMGADLTVQNKRRWGREPVADVMVRGGNRLKGINIGGEYIPRLIDELPVLAVAAAVAEGRTVISDASELRVKEADRISALSAQLRKMGIGITETEDGMSIEGGNKLHGAEVESCGDHRIAMAMVIAGLVAGGETAVHDAEVIGVSYPEFMAALRSLVTG